MYKTVLGGGGEAEEKGSLHVQLMNSFYRMSSETSDQFVVFDTIRSSICFQKAVAEGWIKVG